MPIFEYICKSCGESIEVWGNDEPLCPKCKNKMEKIISKSTFILKGGGWYSEGYNKKEKE